MNKKTILLLLAAVLALPLAAKNLKNLPDSKTPRFKLTDRVWNTTPGDATVCIWADDKLAVYTVTMDVCNSNDNVWWLEIAEKYNLKLTWFIVTRNVGEGRIRNSFGTWPEKEKLYAMGHAIQSHTATHRNKEAGLSAEDDYVESIEAINKNMKTNRGLVVAYPGGQGSGALPNDPVVAAKHLIAARGARPFPNMANQINYMMTNSGSGLPNVDKSNARMYILSVIDPADKNFRGWFCSHFHGLHGQDKAKAQLVKVLDLIKENEKDFWLPNYVSVVKYGQERDTAKLTVTQNTASAIKFNLTDDMDDSLFDYPLTVKVVLPENWQEAAATQNGKPVECKTIEHDKRKYALVQAIPDRGEVALIAKK